MRIEATTTVVISVFCCGKIIDMTRFLSNMLVSSAL